MLCRAHSFGTKLNALIKLSWRRLREARSHSSTAVVLVQAINEGKCCTSCFLLSILRQTLT